MTTPEPTRFHSFQTPDEESKAIAAVLAYGEIYGYGNMIARLKRAWIDHLKAAYNFTEKHAELLADASAYPNYLHGQMQTQQFDPISPDNSPDRALK